MWVEFELPETAQVSDVLNLGQQTRKGECDLREGAAENLSI
jgi:hypothetical protein